MNKVIAILFALVFPVIAHSATVFTPPIDAPYGQMVFCEAINVVNSNVTITSSVVNGCGGNILATQACPTTYGFGCAAIYTSDFNTGGSAFYFCRFDTDSSSPAKIRANGRVYDPTTHATTYFGTAE